MTFVEGQIVRIQLDPAHHAQVRAGEPVTEFQAEGEHWKVKLVEVLNSPDIRIRLVSRMGVS